MKSILLTVVFSFVVASPAWAAGDRPRCDEGESWDKKTSRCLSDINLGKERLTAGSNTDVRAGNNSGADMGTAIDTGTATYTGAGTDVNRYN